MNVIDKNFYELVNELRTLSKDEIFINIKGSFDKIPEQTKLSLEDYFKRFDYWGRLDLTAGDYDQLYQKAKSFSEHVEDYVWLYERLGDYRSKKLLYAIMNNWYRYDFITLDGSHEKNFSHYFDLDLIPGGEGDVFVDLGAYTGDTINDYIKTYGSKFKRIYGYEITDETYEKLVDNTSSYENIIVRKKAILDKTGKVYLNDNQTDASANRTSDSGEKSVETTSLDEDVKEPISVIKMDIEGGEQKAIIGCKNHIICDHPKLLISVYHNNEDVWKIPKMINDICLGYKFYLRSYGGNIYPTEIVLVAIYKE